MMSSDDAIARIVGEDELKRLARQVKELVPCHEMDQDDRMQITSLLDRIFATAQLPSLLATHRVAAWNLLCAFVDEIARSCVQCVRGLLWEHSIWFKAFDLYIDQSQHARPKSAKQMLVSLGNALRKCEDLSHPQQHIAETICGYLSTDDRPRRTKASLQLLSHFLSKDLLELGALSSTLFGCTNISADSAPNADIQSLLLTLFNWASHEDFGSIVGRCISVVLDKHSQRSPNWDGTASSDDPSPTQPVWSPPLNSCICEGGADIDQLRVHVFPVLFKRSLAQYAAFLRSHGLHELSPDCHTEGSGVRSVERRRLLHAALQSGKGLGLVWDSDGSNIRQQVTALHIPVRAYGPLLADHARETRIAGLSLLISSHSVTRPFLPQTFQLLRRKLPTFFSDTDANFRGEVSSLMQRLLDRLRAVTAMLARTAAAGGSAANDLGPATVLERHRAFLRWLLRFLAWELRSAASYQRHISALKTLSIVVRSGVDDTVLSMYWSKLASAETQWPFNLAVLQPGLRQMLLDLLLDPFDDVRQLSASVLAIYASSSWASHPSSMHKDLTKIIKRAEKTMIATGRADQAEGVAHIYSLLHHASSSAVELDAPTRPLSKEVFAGLLADVEVMIERARTNLAMAASRYPMHGLLTSIRFILAQDAMVLDDDESQRLRDCLSYVWQVVRPVLCNDAPEGYEPDGIEGLPELATKDTLSYCWRALKESSLLLGAIVTRKHFDAGHVAALSELCFTELAELRHRGAFSAVAQTWVLCCGHAANDAPIEEPGVLGTWYTRILDILRNKTTINTRRSAGIPSLICGLLIADKSGRLLARAFEDLTGIAKEPVDSISTKESSLPQVHALNCLKDILKNTRLGELSEQHIPQSLRLAADSLRSDAWAVRNCGLMLFRGVIDRLLGTSDVYLEDDALKPKGISIQQHPDLLDIVLGLLVVQDSVELDLAPRHEGVFPALQMLQQMDIPSTRRQEAQAAVMALTASPSWHVRDKAARTCASLVACGENEAMRASTELAFTLANHMEDANAVQGALLCAKYITKSIAALCRAPRRPGTAALRVTEALVNTVSSIIRLTCDQALTHEHPVVRSTATDVLAEFVRFRHWVLKHFKAGEARKNLDLSLPLSLLDSLRDVLRRSLGPKGEDAIERASLSRATARELLFRCDDAAETHLQSASAVGTIIALGEQDADACADFWRTMRTEQRVEAKGWNHLKDVLLPAATKMLTHFFDAHLQCEVQRFLLRLADDGTVCNGFVETCSTSSFPFASSSNQTFADQWLQLRALTLDHQLEKIDTSADHLIQFIAACRAAVEGEGFYSREAAALALSRMKHIWHFVAGMGGSLACDSYLIVYDLLSDDDEDLRLLAAQTVSYILTASKPQATNTHLEPITASQALLFHACTHLTHSRAFATEAFARAFNAADPVVDQLHASAERDTALFATEKQNLYVDPAREAKAWSQVLLRLPTSSLPTRLVRDLACWVDEGLYTLTARFGTGARDGGNGAVGWTSTAEVFTLGLRVVYGAEVLYRHVEKGGRLPIEVSELVRRLAMLANALEEEGGGNVLWRWEVERVLGKIVQGRLRLAWALVRETRELAKQV